MWEGLHWVHQWLCWHGPHPLHWKLMGPSATTRWRLWRDIPADSGPSWLWILIFTLAPYTLTITMMSMCQLLLWKLGHPATCTLFELFLNVSLSLNNRYLWLAVLLKTIAPSAAPELLSLVSKTSSSLTLSWNSPPFEETNGPIQYYTVRVTEFDTNTTFPARNSFNTQITFSNLHPYYIYQCTVATYTIGIGPYTQPISVQLDQEGITCF